MRTVHLFDYLKYPRTIKQVAANFGVSEDYAELRIDALRHTPFLSRFLFKIYYGWANRKSKTVYVTNLRLGIKNRY